MKKTPLKKKSTLSIRKIQDLIWIEARRIVAEQFGTDCFTCGAKNLQGSNKQLGHMWAKASLGAFLKYDIRLLRFQCATCNLFRGGMGADFYKRMLKEQGKEYMERLERDRQRIVKTSDYYPALLKEYQGLSLI